MHERSEQVAFTGDIYQRADSVIIWLGLEGNSSESALELIEFVGTRVDADWNRGELKPSALGEADNPELADITKPLLLSKPDFVSLMHLISRDWFERLWIRQEVTPQTNVRRTVHSFNVEQRLFCGNISALPLTA